MIFLTYFFCSFTDIYSAGKLQHRIYITIITISSRLTTCLAHRDDVFANYYYYWLFKINTMIPFYIYSTVLSRGDRLPAMHITFAKFLLLKVRFRENCLIYGTSESMLYHTRNLWCVPSNPINSQERLWFNETNKDRILLLQKVTNN